MPRTGMVDEADGQDISGNQVAKNQKGKRNMRRLSVGSNENTAVFAVDERGPGNANHRYQISLGHSPAFKESINVIWLIDFQKGPINEVGVNGIQNEDLIAIVIDRLRSFQEGDYPCVENGKALVDLHGALYHLQNRTQERYERGVEGTSQV